MPINEGQYPAGQTPQTVHSSSGQKQPLQRDWVSSPCVPSHRNNLCFGNGEWCRPPPPQSCWGGGLIPRHPFLPFLTPVSRFSLHLPKGVSLAKCFGGGSIHSPVGGGVHLPGRAQCEEGVRGLGGVSPPAGPEGSPDQAPFPPLPLPGVGYFRPPPGGQGLGWVAIADPPPRRGPKNSHFEEEKIGWVDRHPGGGTLATWEGALCYPIAQNTPLPPGLVKESLVRTPHLPFYQTLVPSSTRGSH